MTLQRAATVRPLAPRPLYEHVAERLRAQIDDRLLEPGQWIDELKLAGELGISRTPMREALKVLAAEGLVTMRPRRGAYVTEVSADDVRQVYRLLALLESEATAEVAARASDADKAELRRLHAALESQVRQRDAFFAANERFHRRVLELSGNRWALQIVDDLRKVMRLARHHSLLRRGRLTQSLAEHAAILAAIDAGDATHARHLTLRHFENGLAAARAAD